MRNARHPVASQEKLAQEMGVTLRTIQRWEKGTSEPRAGQLARLANVLGVELDALFHEAAA